MKAFYPHSKEPVRASRPIIAESLRRSKPRQDDIPHAQPCAAAPKGAGAALALRR